MSLSYENHVTFPIIGTKDGTTRTSIALTDAYDVANKTKEFAVGGYSKANFDILYTMGATETSNSIELRIEGSSDGTNWYRLANESVSAGTSTLTRREFTYVGVDAAATTISIGLDIFYKYLKVSVKETGKVTNFGTVYIDCTLSGK